MFPQNEDGTQEKAEGPTSGRLGPMLAAARLRAGLSMQRVAERAGCAKSSLSEIENGRRVPADEEFLSRVATALSLDEAVVVGAARWDRAMSSGGPVVRAEVRKWRTQSAAASELAAMLRSRPGGLDEAYRSGRLASAIARMTGEPASAPDSARVEGALCPRVGQERPDLVPLGMDVPLINRVAAGYPREFTDLGYPARIADEYVRCPEVSDPEAFAARVVGDSMQPQYVEGDVVIFSPNRTVKSGDDCFVRLERDGETTFKRVYFETGEDGAEMIRLQPMNSAYPPRVLEREEVAGVYAAVAWMRKVGSVTGNGAACA